MTIRSTKSSGEEAAVAEHRRVRELLAKFHETLRKSSGSPDMAALAIQYLRENLLEHFRGEESGGYFTEALEIAPHLREQVERLLAQHSQMTAQLTELEQQARRTPATAAGWQELESQFADFLHVFEAHEAEESRVMHAAFSNDLSAQH
jgi:hypothetical protein